MTTRGIGFSERIQRLLNRVAARRRATAAERARIRAERRRGRVVKRGDWRELLEILFWTLVVVAGWMLWNRGIWGWW